MSFLAAVMFYKQSMQLVPDVESRVQESEGNSRSGKKLSVVMISSDSKSKNCVVRILSSYTLETLYLISVY